MKRNQLWVLPSQHIVQNKKSKPRACKLPLDETQKSNGLRNKRTAIVILIIKLCCNSLWSLQIQQACWILMNRLICQHINTTVRHNSMQERCWDQPEKCFKMLTGCQERNHSWWSEVNYVGQNLHGGGRGRFNISNDLNLKFWNYV